ncbi:phosphotransferase [Slackia heliotrinireducens]|uniref:phosphotransferase n=1 Tax=Slackia heliotrinireducens TaxID=84110 RepID=UPI00331597EA
MITRNEFETLCAIRQNPGATQRELADALGVSLGTVNNVHRSLTKAKLIEEGRITARGLKELRPYKVENAVIMAAGLSSRFAPISYERPKGLLKVRGEVLIERQIEQLMEAGVNEIVVVVGYKCELFFYLEEKYGVQIVVNHEYASKNNHSTLMRVREMLGNTYICSSDDYFTTNPFEQYVWKAYYSAEFSEGPTREWCMETDRKGRIDKVTVGGENAWYMTGHAYFDKAFSDRFVEILEAEYDDPRTADKLWEELYIEHIDEFDMEIKEYEPDVIFEFDSLDELRDFDPLFLENVDSSIFDNIVAVLGCDKSEIRDVYPLKQGLTNLSCHFTTDDGEYVYRHPGVGTEQMIDRSAEVQALNLAKSIGIDKTFVFENAKTGWKISKFIKNCRELDPRDDAQLAEAMQVAHKLHGQNVSLDRHFDYLQEGLKYEKLLLKKGPINVPGYEELKAQAEKARAYAAQDNAPECLTHNDFFNLNLLYDEEGNLSLIDWEYAGMSDYASDYGTFVVTCMLNDEEADRALEHYFGRTPTLEERRHNYAFVGLAGWCWYVWSLQKESEGDYVGEWLYTYYRYAKKYLPKAIELYEQPQE